MRVRSNSVSGIYKFEQGSCGPKPQSLSISSGGGGGSSQGLYLVLNIDSIPAWLRRVFGLEKEGLLRFVGSIAVPLRPVWNMLVKLSWGVVRGRSVPSLLPDNEFVRSVASRIYELFRFGRFVEVVASPRIGKTAGVIYGLVEMVVLKDLQNFVVLYVVPNRRLALTAYRYALGAVEKLFRNLRILGVKVTRAELYSKIRVRLYLGGEQSCLLGKGKHYIEYCIKGCPLFQKYGNYWKSKLPPVPVLDPWVLKLSGYCPKISAQSKNFWYKSLVVLTFDSLDMAIKKIEDFNIRNVIVVFDEYVYLLKRRGVISRIDIGKVEKLFGSEVLDRSFEYCFRYQGRKYCGSYTLRKVLEGWNSLVDEINRLLVNRYAEVIEDVVKDATGVRRGEVLLEKLHVPIDVFGSVYHKLLLMY